MKRKLVTILIGCMALGLFGCGSGLSDTTKRLTPQQSENSEQNADHTGNEDQQAEADTTEKKAEDGMEELREQMQRLQRIDRDYASVEGNKDKSYLYKASTDIRKEQEKHSNLKTVLSSLTYRNIDINNGGRR